jgi:hypothetical protein
LRAQAAPGLPVGATASVGIVLGLGWVTIAGIASLAGGGASMIASRAGQEPTPGAVADIPPEYLALYRAADLRYGIDWAVLAGIGKLECDHGRDPDPSCATEGAVNAAGAGGPMQFLGETWARYGVDGNGDGRRDRWDAADAVFAAANYLRAAGAPSDYRRAVYAYNHAWWYVADVLHWASVYRAAAATDEQPPALDGETAAVLQARTATPVRMIGGATARLAPGDGHLALVPALAPPAVQAMVIAGNELQGLPYGAAGHPDPRGAAAADCSSTLNFLLYRAGVRPIQEIVAENPLAQSYVTWGLPGPGRWVTIYATEAPTPHVFAVIAGLRIDTSHAGTDIGPNRNQDGPRWRVFDAIPGWAHWSVRHPPGL